MKHYILTLLFILGFAGISSAQYQLNYEIREAVDFYRSNKFIDGSMKSELTEKDIKGSPYLNDEFVNGTIFTVQMLKYSDIPLRFNIYNDDLEFKTPTGEVMALSAPEIVEKAEFGNMQMVYSPYSQTNKIKKGFFVVLEQGKASLYAKPGILFQEPTEPAAYKDAEPAKFVRKADEYYIRIGTEQAILISNKKDLIAVFPDNRDKIESFVNKNKIKTNKPESLKEVVKYYNSIE
jgi:hypothetical protein